MAKDHMSPEERLLSLIRGKHKKPQGAQQPEGPTQEVPPKAAAAQPKDGKPKAHHAGSAFRPSAFRPRLFEPDAFKALNKYLVVLTAIFGVYLVVDMLFVRPDKGAVLQIAEEPAAPGGAVPKAVKGDAPRVRDYSFYSSEISNKNIFGPAPGEDGLPQTVVAAPEEVAGALGLVGIIAGDNPQAVIEDKKAQKTYYLVKGESFNGLTVEEISEGKVVLDYQGKKIALLL